MKRTWMRVKDVGSPLCGWDLLCEPLDEELLEVLGARRLDTFVGDRPIQFRPPDGLGMWIQVDRVQESPVQDDLVEMDSDAVGLYGEHMETREYHHGEAGLDLDVEVFTEAVQVALTVTQADSDSEEKAPVYTHTWFGPPNALLLDDLESLMEEGDREELIAIIEGAKDATAKA